MGHRGSQRNVPHPFTAYFGLNDFDAALFADNAAMLHTLIASAKTFVILNRPEYLGAEQTVSLRLEGPVIDRLRLFDFTVGPGKNLFRRGDRNLHCVESDRIFWFFKINENVFHRLFSYLLKLL